VGPYFGPVPKFGTGLLINQSGPVRSVYLPKLKRKRGKECFVCGKDGCWSTKHSKQERDKSIKPFRDRYAKLERQYLIDCEGTEDNYEDDNYDYDIDNMDDAMHAFVFDTEPLDTPKTPEPP
jgi:hypothetical protein